jgi:hypothetical protein
VIPAHPKVVAVLDPRGRGQLNRGTGLQSCSLSSMTMVLSG